MRYERPPLDEIAPHYGLTGVHEVVTWFPEIGDEEFTALVENVREQGFQQEVVATTDGVLVDGRHRLQVAWIIGRDPTIRRVPIVDPYLWALNANLHHRHLSKSQQVAIGSRYAEHLSSTRTAGRPPKDTKGTEIIPVVLPELSMSGDDTASRPSSSEMDQAAQTPGEAVEIAADMVGVSASQIKKFNRVKREAPDLVADVQSGAMTLDAAVKEVNKRAKAKAKNQPEDEEVKPTKAPTAPPLVLVTDTGEEVPYPATKGKATFNATNEHISWAAWSWNPVTGCRHGCEYCYAREVALRRDMATYYPVGFTPLFHGERLDAPANTKVPADAANDPRRGRVFVCSMADLYGKWVPDEWIEKVHATCIANPQWEYLFLTKFPSRYNRVELPASAWIGTSVDDQRRVPVAEHAFKDIGPDAVRVRWLSLEPLRAPLEFTDLSMFDWVVIGAQTQTVQPEVGVVPSFSPPFEWVARIVAQAREAGVNVYLKPNLLGETNPQSPGMALPQEGPKTLVKSAREERIVTTSQEV